MLKYSKMIARFQEAEEAKMTPERQAIQDLKEAIIFKKFKAHENPEGSELFNNISKYNDLLKSYNASHPDDKYTHFIQIVFKWSFSRKALEAFHCQVKESDYDFAPVIGILTGRTYDLRDKLKEGGARWDSSNSQWECPILVYNDLQKLINFYS